MSSANSGKPVAVVTGAVGGIGRVICARLADDGFHVVGLDVRDEASFETIQCDVSDDVSVASAVRAIDEKYGRIDAAVHAAGISSDAVVWKLGVDEWDRVHAVNLRGAFVLIRHVVPVMRRASEGRIVLIGSINGSRGKFGTAAYSSSKAGLIGLAKTVCRETGRFGVRVNVVEPGWVVTPLTESASEAIRDKAKSETLLGELIEPQDVAAAVGFLCGEGGRRITGQVLRVDAGQYLGSM